MNKNNLYLTSAAALVALVAVAGIGYMTYAQTADDTAAVNGRQGMRGWIDDILTDDQKAQIEAKRTTFEAERDARRQEMQDAIAAGYDSWKAKVVEKQGADAPILDEVTSNEFAKFQEAHGYMNDAHELTDKARALFEEIGVTRMGKGNGMGMMGGEGMGMGGHRGGRMGGGMMGGNLDN